MLRSLFGELYPLRDLRKARKEVEVAFAPTEFAATAVLEHTARAIGSAGLLIDKHVQDLFISGAPAEGMRAHFANARASAPNGQRFITLVDPAQMWAASVLKALSEAGGQPIERLHLRDQASLQTLALIERTTLHRRSEEALKIYHADVRAQGRDAAAISLALMERADMTVVVVGPLHPSLIDEQIRILRSAANTRTWQCSEVLFMLPIGARWVADRIDRMDWPAGVNVRSIMEPMTSASAVWNALLAHWNLVKPALVAPPPSVAGRASDSPAAGKAPSPARRLAPQDSVWPSGFGNLPPLHDLSLSAPIPLQTPATAQAAIPKQTRERSHPPMRDIEAVVDSLSRVDGLQFVAVIDVASTFVLSAKGQSLPVGTLAEVAQRVTELVAVHRKSLPTLGHSRSSVPVDEILVTAGSLYHILRGLQAYPDCFVLGIADKLRSNLAMTRFRVMEAQKNLG